MSRRANKRTFPRRLVPHSSGGVPLAERRAHRGMTGRLSHPLEDELPCEANSVEGLTVVEAQFKFKQL